jgi:hypothetical protein
VQIRFYPEKAIEEQAIPPTTSHTPTAWVYSDGVIRLTERIYFFDRLYPDVQDAIVEIRVNGQLVYRDKAKSDVASRLGLRRCRSLNGYFIDRILPRALSQR